MGTIDTFGGPEAEVDEVEGYDLPVCYVMPPDPPKKAPEYYCPDCHAKWDAVSQKRPKSKIASLPILGHLVGEKKSVMSDTHWEWHYVEYRGKVYDFHETQFQHTVKQTVHEHGCENWNYPTMAIRK